MGRSIVFGYIKSFSSVSLVSTGGSTVIVPMECRLNSGQAAKVITLANGVAYNMNETAYKSGAQTRYPVEQRLSIMVRSSGGGRSAIDAALANIDEKHGVQGTLVVTSGRDYSCTAVLDEIIEEGDMDKGDSSDITYGTFTLVFQQLTEWK